MLTPVVVTRAGKVSLTYPSLPDFKLEMDFNPFVDGLRLGGQQFCLAHWQAKPFGQRRWGIYDSGSDNYVSLKYSQLQALVVPQFLQVDENLIKTVPTAVLYFPNARVVENGYYSIIAT